MNSLTQEIAARVSTLPEQKQQEALDFIEFLQIKLAREKAERSNADLLANPESQTDGQTEGAKMLHLLEAHGLLGCMEGDGKLSVDYKQHLWGNG
jgi:Protein of unknown function (DUF2281)